jgi:hypothetical protein
MLQRSPICSVAEEFQRMPDVLLRLVVWAMQVGMVCNASVLVSEFVYQNSFAATLLLCSVPLASCLVPILPEPNRMCFLCWRDVFMFNHVYHQLCHVHLLTSIIIVHKAEYEAEQSG